MPVGDYQVEPAVEVEIGEQATEPQTVARGRADARLRRDIPIVSGLGPVQTDHLALEVRDGQARRAGVVEVGDIDAHAGPGLAVGAQRNPGLERRRP